MLYNKLRNLFRNIRKVSKNVSQKLPLLVLKNIDKAINIERPVLLIAFLFAVVKKGVITMYMANHEIKSLIKSLRFSQAQVAKEMGISYSYFSKMLQVPLSPQWARRVDKALKQLLHERTTEEQKVAQWFDNPKSGLLGEDWYKNNAKK